MVIIVTTKLSLVTGLARSLRDALEVDKRIKNSIPSTKGSI